MRLGLPEISTLGLHRPGGGDRRPGPPPAAGPASTRWPHQYSASRPATTGMPAPRGRGRAGPGRRVLGPPRSVLIAPGSTPHPHAGGTSLGPSSRTVALPRRNLAWLLVLSQRACSSSPATDRSRRSTPPVATPQRVADLFWWMAAGGAVWVAVVVLALTGRRASGRRDRVASIRWRHRDRAARALIIGGGAVVSDGGARRAARLRAGLMPELLAPPPPGSL